MTHVGEAGTWRASEWYEDLEGMVREVAEMVEVINTVEFSDLSSLVTKLRTHWYPGWQLDPPMSLVGQVLKAFMEKAFEHASDMANVGPMADEWHARRVDDEGVFSHSVQELCESFGSVLESPEEAMLLYWLYCSEARISSPTLKMAYDIGLVLERLREIDPGLQVVGPGLASMGSRLASGEHPDAMIETIHSTISKGLGAVA